MNILITGAKGFVGKNLIAALENVNILSYDIDTDPALLDDYCKVADFVLHLAGVNRPEDPADSMITTAFR